MGGGEIFIPKMPSVYITDLAKAIDKNYKFKEIGLGQGENYMKVYFLLEIVKIYMKIKICF